MLTPISIAGIIAGYFVLLLIIAYLTGKKSDHKTFFTGNNQSPWIIVSYGMIGAALSAVTFVSIPGSVYAKGFYAAQFFLGNMVGYAFITFVLIPLYYRLKLVSIYSFLEERFGWYSYKTGSFFFLVSQSFGAGLRLLLAIKILQVLFDLNNNQIWWLSLLFLALIFLYTFKAGIKTIVWTDLLQTTFLLLAALSIVFVILNQLSMPMDEIIAYADKRGYWKWYDGDLQSGTYFWKQFIAGILIAMAMMGLDQNMMQKSLTCKNVAEAQKNTFVFSFSVGIAQILFLFLGMLLYVYADLNAISLPVNEVIVDGGIKTTMATDKVLPFLTVNHFGLFASVMFVLGTAAAAFSSVDSALTALTTSFCYDFLGIEERVNAKRLRLLTHIGFSLVMFLIVMSFSSSGSNVFDLIFGLAGYTYSPLLGLFLIGIFSNIKIWDKATPFICLLTPVIAYFLNDYLMDSFGFNIGFLTILTGALITMILIAVFSKIGQRENS